MAELTRMDRFAAVHADGEDVLGKLVYYSLSSLLVEKDVLSGLCEDMGFPYRPSKRIAVADAFRSATGDIYEQKAVQTPDGPMVYKVYYRDNRSTKDLICRELVKETIHADTNQYKKLANVSYDKRSGAFSYDNLAFDAQVDPLTYCTQAQELFELYQRCVGRKQVETLLENYLDALQAVKVVSHGKLYFVPRDEMERVSLFEDFIELVEQHNQYQSHSRSPLDSNSMFVVDDEKQRGKMAAAFYRSVRKEIEEYQQRADHLIQTGSQSPAILDRCVLRIQSLEQKKQSYEGILRQELHELDDEFTSLTYLSDELRIRARGLRAQKERSQAA